MGNKLLFIDNSESFILKSMMGELEKKHIPCMFLPMKVSEISNVREDINDYIFINISDLASFDKMALTYIKDICLEDDIKLYLMGYQDDIDALKKQYFSMMDVGQFCRPINAKQVSEDIEIIVKKADDELKKKHILVVDDSGTMLTTIKSWLEDKYRVSMVNSAINAITFLAKAKPDLILLDYEMPVCTGAQFLEMMKSNPDIADIPVIFLTGKNDAESVKGVLKLGVAGYLLKSMPKDHIVSEIDTFFAKQKGEA